MFLIATSIMVVLAATNEGIFALIFKKIFEKENIVSVLWNEYVAPQMN